MSDNPNVAVLRQIAHEMRTRYALPTGHGAVYGVVANNAVDVAAMLLNWAGRVGAAATALEAQASAPGGEVTDSMVKAAGDAIASYWQNLLDDPCSRCAGRGHHHGFGEDGNDPDWCDECGGSGMAEAGSDDDALRAGLTAALAARTGRGESDGR